MRNLSRRIRIIFIVAMILALSQSVVFEMCIRDRIHSGAERRRGTAPGRGESADFKAGAESSAKTEPGEKAAFREKRSSLQSRGAGENG